MRLTRRRILATTAVSVTVAGCLGEGDQAESMPADDDDGTNGDNGTDDDEEAPEDASVQVRSHPEYGDILVGPDEMTLYNFESDTQGEPESTCYDECAESWPPLTVADEPTAGNGVTADLTTFERDDGERQVTADGWPLYYFASDEEPGDAEGQGVNDVWWVLEPDGTLVRPDDTEESDEDEADADEDNGGGSGY